MIAPGNGDVAARNYAPSESSLPPQREADTAPQAYQPPAYEPPAYEAPAYQPPAYQPPPTPTAPQDEGSAGQAAKPAPTYTVWSSTPGDGQPFGPKE
jgi:hypothetical protein